MQRRLLFTTLSLLLSIVAVAQAPESTTQQATEPAVPASEPAQKIPPEQLDALVAPIALYPDPLLAQTLAASTYPIEIVQLQQWLEKNGNLKDAALADAVAKQPWDPSVQAMAALPDVVKRLADDIQWTVDLGNAFLAQRSEVMDAVQRMRKKAQDTGNLKSTPEQKVETKVVESKEVIVVEQANPEVVYIPAYNPVVVYGPPVYPYPSIYYPPPYYYPAGAVAVSFGVGVAMGAFWSGGWGWGCGWGGGGYSDVNINYNNNFVRNTNVRANRGNVGNTRWQHDSRHRGGAPTSYGDRRAGGDRSVSQSGSGLEGNRGGFDGNQGGFEGNRDAGRSSTDGYSRDSGSYSSRGADSIGDRDFSRSSSSSSGAFGGDARGYDGSYSRAASSRGASSMGSRGGSRGGGGRRR
jgi:hypothetical protein